MISGDPLIWSPSISRRSDATLGFLEKLEIVSETGLSDLRFESSEKLLLNRLDSTLGWIGREVML